MTEFSTQQPAPPANMRTINRLLKLDLNAAERAFVYMFFRDGLSIEAIADRLQITSASALDIYNALHNRLFQTDKKAYYREREHFRRLKARNEVGNG